MNFLYTESRPQGKQAESCVCTIYYPASISITPCTNSYWLALYLYSTRSSPLFCFVSKYISLHREYFVLRGKMKREGGENYTMRSFVPYKFHQTLGHIRVMKLRMMRWTGHVVCMKDTWNSSKFIQN